MSSRLDLLKKGAGNTKEKDSKKNSRSGLLDEKPQKSQRRQDDLIDKDKHKDDEFENETDHSQNPEYDIDDDDDNDDSDENVNVIEINLDESQGLDPSLLDDDFIEEKETTEPSKETHQEEPEEKHQEEPEDSFNSDIVEGRVSVDYGEEDIKQELEYTFDHREQVYNSHFRIIKDGGMEISTPQTLHLGDIIRISITLTELKEQVGCETRVVSVYPKNIRLSNKENSNQYRYIVQFIGPNASETERILNKYLLGYKIK
ncbi:PilZ domain-containing protein [Francisella uliginis]|uniref:PilZ domain-containing protein n=1 Tax=Francisella uliginis TaxID=573570 RepID=A0A1L4BQW1_9GAMM|nr:PilZ domain-containing protein [Francisella uliginis]API86229.1 hypothetical protein F7310_02160 [Francisella uliginis]